MSGWHAKHLKYLRRGPMKPVLMSISFTATRWTALAATLAGLALAAPAQAASCAGAGVEPGNASPVVVRDATLCMLNRQRAAHGLRPLRHERRLALAAHRHVRDMIKGGYFAHQSRSGTNFVQRIQRTGYARGSSWRLGENLAWGEGVEGSPNAIVAAWMESPGHRRNVLGPYREVGIGLAAGAPVAGRGPSTTFATDFGSGPDR